MVSTHDLSRRVLIGSAALVLAGCATFTPDGGLGTVSKQVEPRIGTTLAPRDANVEQEVSSLLGQEMNAANALRVALLNNPGLRASLAELGIAEAERVLAGRLANPHFSWARFRMGDEREIERKVVFDLLGLILLPIKSEMGARQFSRAQTVAAMDVLSVAAEARKAFYSAVAAQQTAQYLEQVKDAADAAATLAREMARVGNWNRLQQAREQSFYADATAQLARGRLAAASERERLIRALGLWGEQTSRLKLPERLPELPATARDVAELESRAIGERLDVQLARGDVDATAKALGLTKVNRFVSALEIGYERDSKWEGNEKLPRRTGYEIDLTIPIFDFGEAKVAKAEAIYLQSAERLREVAVNARSEVREAYVAYRTAYDLAKHYRDEIVPLRKVISEENLLRYNGMLIGVFELLADARDQVASVIGAVDTLRDFWMADSDLQMALTGRSPGMMKRSGGAVMTKASEGGH